MNYKHQIKYLPSGSGQAVPKSQFTGSCFSLLQFTQEAMYAVALAFIWTLIMGLCPALMVQGKSMTCCSNDFAMAGARFRLNSDNMLMMVHRIRVEAHPYVLC